jgi:hypothetical protein
VAYRSTGAASTATFVDGTVYRLGEREKGECVRTQTSCYMIKVYIMFIVYEVATVGMRFLSFIGFATRVASINDVHLLAVISIADL